MNYPDSVRFLYSLGNEIKTAKFDLTRITALLAALGDPHRAGRFVHVAGTNGKGSVSAMIESALRAAGLRTGLFTSPHLLEPTERIRISGQPVTAGTFSGAFDRVHEAAERLLGAGAIDFHPTYFETVTAMAFLLFRDLAVDCAVIEVGLGGRLDATNVVLPELVVITPVDFDHEVFLGNTLARIASEKGGILKPGAPAVFAAQRAEAGATLDSQARELGLTVHRSAGVPAIGLDLHRDGHRYRSGDLLIDCPLPGEHQVENSRTAVAALRALGIPDFAIGKGIHEVRWPGRLQRISSGGRDVLLDGAHNPSGARALAAYLQRFYSGAPITLVFGVMRDKSVAEIAGILFPLARTVIATAPDQPRAIRPEVIREVDDHPDLRVAPSLSEALDMVPREGVVVVTGSLFLVSEALARLGGLAW